MNAIFFSFYLFILLISFVTSIWNRNNLPAYFGLFSILTGATFLIESVAFYLLFFTSGKTHFLYHYFLPFSYSLLAVIYLKTVRSSWRSTLIKLSIPAFLLVHFYLSVFVQGIDTVNSYAIMGAALLIILCTLFYFYELLTNKEIVRLSTTPLFWISTGNIFFYTGVFFLMGLLNYLMQKEPGLARKLIVLNYSLNYVLYTLYIIGFLCTARLRKSSL